MHILSINAGSATLKFGVFDPASATPQMEATIGHPAVDAAAFDEIERRLREAGVTAIDAVGHRVAHGGPRLSESVRIDVNVERDIERAAALAPQHNPVALVGIRLARERCGRRSRPCDRDRRRGRSGDWHDDGLGALGRRARVAG